MGVGCCVRVLRARSQRLWTKPQGATGGVPGVNGVGLYKGPIPIVTPHNRVKDALRSK